jgi:dipeptidyl-peptidase-4
LLISTETESIYRHSTKALYYIYNLKDKTLKPVTEAKAMYGTFSPDGQKVAFVRDNNLFYKDLNANKEIQVTTDGKLNNIINGATDWVYEEEFSFSQGYQWNSDGSHIAYYKFDESGVKEFNLTTYGNLYPTENRYKYPKAGEQNSVVEIYTYELASAKNQKVNTGENKDQYIPRIKWTTNPALLSFQRLNRHQNVLELILADVKKGTVNTILKESNPTYIDITDDLTFLKDGSGFLWSSELQGFNHIYYYNMNGKLINQVTTGSFDITELKGIDEQAKTIYYVSAEESPMTRTVYSIKLDGKNKKKLSAKSGTNAPTFSNGFKFFINNHSDANTPSFISLHDQSGKLIRVLEDNKALVTTLSTYNLSPKTFFTIKTSEGVNLNAWIIKPAGFDSTRKYPVLMTVYGGPGHNTVNDMWEAQNYLWHQMLAQNGYIVVSIDNRGTGFRGQDFKKSTYKQLGKLETIDQIESAKFLGNLRYVDKSRIGIQGWSFGGYMSSLCMTKGADFFKAGIAVAPVTNWRYYDSIYTERFLQTPQENPAGYDENSPINFVKQLKGKYLLVHGTADDNVHYQNSMEMTTALVRANKPFEMFMYPDKNHGIYGGTTRLHLYTLMTDFIKENL